MLDLRVKMTNNVAWSAAFHKENTVGASHYTVMTQNNPPHPQILLERRLPLLVLVVDAVAVRQPRRLALHHQDRGAARRPGRAQVPQPRRIRYQLPLALPGQHRGGRGRDRRRRRDDSGRGSQGGVHAGVRDGGGRVQVGGN